MSNSITTHTLAAKTTTSIGLADKVCIQSDTQLVLQFSDKVGSFTLFGEFEFQGETTLYITNPFQWPATFVIVNSPMDEDPDEEYPDEETVYLATQINYNTNIFYIGSNGGMAYLDQDEGKQLVTMIRGHYYPLVYGYLDNKSIFGKWPSMDAFEQLAGNSLTSSGEMKIVSDSVVLDGKGYSVDVDMSYMAVKNNNTGEWVSHMSDEIINTKATDEWNRQSKQFTISMLGEYSVYWAISADEQKFVYETLDLPVGTYTMSRYVNTNGDVFGLMNITKGTELKFPFTKQGTYEGCTVMIMPQTPNFVRYIITYVDGTTHADVLEGMLTIPIGVKLIEKVQFLSENKV